MKKKSLRAPEDKQKSHLKWVLIITIVAFFISVLITFFVEVLLSSTGISVSFFILIAIILIGILFDIVGVAIAAVDDKPFHSMASAKVSGAMQSLVLIRNASKVSNVCNDVVGDLCGIISGSSATFIVLQVGTRYSLENTAWLSMALGGLVASLTIGGKAMGKDLALNYSKEIITFCGKLLSKIGWRK